MRKIPLLLLLLLPHGYLAEQVCFNISDGEINVNLGNIAVHDHVYKNVECKVYGQPCIIKCTFSNLTWFNGSSGCIEGNVTTMDGMITHDMHTYSTCIIYLCVEKTIMSLITSLDTDTAGREEIMQLVYIKVGCSQLFSTNHQVKKLFIKVERKIICSIMRKSHFGSGNSVLYSLQMLALNVVNISDAELNSTQTRIPIEAPQLLPENKSYVPEMWLPVSGLQTIPQNERIIGIVSYMEGDLFQENIASMVIRIEHVGEQHFVNLKTSIQMIFKIFPAYREHDKESRLQCRYFDEQDWHWKADGCETIKNETCIICDCNHSTPFAVLLIRTNEISEVHWKILSHLSYIGCGLSSFFTALSFIMCAVSRTHKRDHSISIHVSLSGALFLLNVTFLLAEWGATVEQSWVCVFVAAFMHYSLLCCFTWMAIEALHLYLLLIKVFNTYYKHYLVKLSLAGWGIPAVIVAVSVGIQDFKQFYGVTQMTMADANQTAAICWITDDAFFYSVNLLYFTLIFIFNSGILSIVASNMCKMKQVFRSNSNLGQKPHRNTLINPERLSESCRSTLTVLGLTCLMGTTWGLAFLGSGYVNYPILYLFCILNSMQGFFIFLWVHLSVRKQRRRDKEDRMTSTAAKTSEVKSY